MSKKYIRDLTTKRSEKIDFTKKYLILSAILYLWSLVYLGYIVFFIILSILIPIGLYLGYHMFFVSKNGLEISKDFIRVKKKKYYYEQYIFNIQRINGLDKYLLGEKLDSSKQYHVLSFTIFNLDYEDVIHELKKYIEIEIEETY